MRESCTSGSERGKPCKGLTYLPNFIYCVSVRCEVQLGQRVAIMLISDWQ